MLGHGRGNERPTARRVIAISALAFATLSGGLARAQDAPPDATSTTTTTTTLAAAAAEAAASTAASSTTTTTSPTATTTTVAETTTTATAPAGEAPPTAEPATTPETPTDTTDTPSTSTTAEDTTTTVAETTTSTTAPAAVAVATASLVDPATCRVGATVRLRDYGVQVECVEAALVKQGYTLAGPNLYYDYSTQVAVTAFQKARSLAADGIAGPATLYALGVWAGGAAPATCTVASTLRVRAYGNDVLCLEGALMSLGYTLAGPNLYFDNSTLLAVQAFQRARNLYVDGIAGPQTLRALGIYPGSTAPPPTTPPPTTPPPTTPPPTTPSPTCKVSAAIAERAYGAHVQCLEQALVSRGYSLAGPNLYFDHSTFLAVQAFQRSRGQVADGIAGPATLSALGIWNGPPPSLQGLPASSGTGRRIVYHRGQQRVWAVDASGNVIKTHRVSGRLYEPYRGTYSVYSRSLYTYATGNPDVKWRYMVRFAYGPNGGRIGFHEIPQRFGVPLQSVAQLGQPLSGGCVRQSTPDAQWMWNWAGVGTKVVVI